MVDGCPSNSMTDTSARPLGFPNNSVPLSDDVRRVWGRKRNFRMPLKYGLGKQLPPKVLVGPKGAASQALEKLMGEAYPKSLQDTEMESVLSSQRSKAMKNKLSTGHNWHVWQARFGIGILALLPVGKEVGVCDSDIEKAQHSVFAQILDLLQRYRGDALSELGGAVLENVFDSILATPGVPSFVFDDDDEQNQPDEAPYDSPALVGRFRLRSV